MSTCLTGTSTSGRSAIPPPPPPVWLPPIRAGEVDGRFLNCAADLGAYGDSITDISTVSLTIARQDGRPITSVDLQAGGQLWPNSLDSTGLIPTFGFQAPATNPGVTYVLTMTVNKTAQGRLFIRDMYMQVTTRLG